MKEVIKKGIINTLATSGGNLHTDSVTGAYKIVADKTQTENSWFAWIPILQTILLFNIAKQSPWWLLIILVPLIGAITFLVMMIMVMVRISVARGQSGWLVILLFLPLGPHIFWGYLAFSKTSAEKIAAA